MFPFCKRMNALLNVCYNKKNQSTGTYVLFLQGKLKELKKHPWVSCKAKVFIRHKQKVTCLPYHKKNLYSYNSYKIAVDEYIKNLWYNLVLINLKDLSCRDHAKLTI